MLEKGSTSVLSVGNCSDFIDTDAVFDSTYQTDSLSIPDEVCAWKKVGRQVHFSSAFNILASHAWPLIRETEARTKCGEVPTGAPGALFTTLALLLKHLTVRQCRAFPCKRLFSLSEKKKILHR